MAYDKKIRTVNIICCVLIGFLILLPTVLAFRSRIQTGEGGTPIVVEKNKLNTVGAAGDTYTVSSLKFVDKDGNVIAVINAGPPPTIEITDERGKVKVIDLRKLASRVSIFGETE